MKYRSGQWLFLQVPAVSGHQWHPFTITSCPADPYISVHIRQVGDFTKQLAALLGVTSDEHEKAGIDPMGVYEIAMQNGYDLPRIKVDGPYGAPAEDVFDNEIAVLIGTGIGVTPWASVLKSIWHRRNYPERFKPMKLRKVEFIWICRDTTSFEWFHALLMSLEKQSNGAARDFLSIHTYLTQRVNIDTAQNIVLNSVGMDYDPLTRLRTGTRYGRPNFKQIFTTLREGIRNKTYMPGLESQLKPEVGVYFCGPSAAARDIKKACKAVTTDDVKFGFWKEQYVIPQTYVERSSGRLLMFFGAVFEHIYEELADCLVSFVYSFYDWGMYDARMRIYCTLSIACDESITSIVQFLFGGWI